MYKYNVVMYKYKIVSNYTISGKNGIIANNNLNILLSLEYRLFYIN